MLYLRSHRVPPVVSSSGGEHDQHSRHLTIPSAPNGNLGNCNAYHLCFVVTTAAAGIFGSAISSPVSSLESEGRPLTLVTREISSVVADDIELDAPGAETTVESGSWPSWRLLTQ